MVHQVFECVAKDRAEIHQHVDARPPKLFKRDQAVVADLALPVIFRPRPKEAQHARHGLAFRLDRVESPEHLRHCFRIGAVFSEVPRQNRVGHLRTTRVRQLRWNAPRVDGVQVAARRQHVGAVTNQIAAWSRGDVAAAQAVHQSVELAAIVGEQPRQLATSAHQRLCVRVGAEIAVREQHAVRRRLLTEHGPFHKFARALVDAFAHFHRSVFTTPGARRQITVAAVVVPPACVAQHDAAE